MKTFKGTEFTWKALPSHGQKIDIVAGGNTVIAVVKPRDAKGEAAENAKLIAAAPELLKALQEILEGKGSYDTDQLKHASNCIEEMKELARKAINKALK